MIFIKRPIILVVFDFYFACKMFWSNSFCLYQSPVYHNKLTQWKEWVINQSTTIAAFLYMAYTLVWLRYLWFCDISCAHFQCYLSLKPQTLQRVKCDVRRQYFIFSLKQWSIKTKKQYIKEIPISVLHHKKRKFIFDKKNIIVLNSTSGKIE